MKRFLSLIALILTFCLLTGCQTGPAGAPPALINFPGVSWNITPEEFIQTMDLKESDYTLEAETPRRVVLSVENLKVFGSNATVVFEFLCFEADHHGLHTAYVFYPDSVNFDTVRKQVEREYGPSIELPYSDQTAYYWDGTETLEQYALQVDPDYTSQSSSSTATRLIWGSDAQVLYGKILNDYWHLLPEAYPSKNILVFYGYVTQLLQYIDYGFTPGVPEG